MSDLDPALLAKIAWQQRAISRTLVDMAALMRNLAEQSEHMEALLRSHGIEADA